MTVAAFGDSITAGYNHANNFGWTTALQADLPSDSFLVDGIVGATLQKNPSEGPSFQEANNQNGTWLHDENNIGLPAVCGHYFDGIGVVCQASEDLFRDSS